MRKKEIKKEGTKGATERKCMRRRESRKMER
jgi:hypothetical protein